MSGVLAAPPGYASLVLFDRQRHRERGIAPRVERFAARLHAVPLTLAEFVAAARTNPIVFAQGEDRAWQPLLLTGFETGRNVCVDSAGDWRRDFYCPAYVRRYPFCTARVAGGGDGNLRTVLCVDEAGLAAEPPHLFDARGAATPRWRELQRFIEEVDAAIRDTEAFCAALTELELFEPFEAEVLPLHAHSRRVTGMSRIAERRLNALAGPTVVRLMRQGYLSRVYAHLMSLDNFQRLLEAGARGVASS